MLATLASCLSSCRTSAPSMSYQALAHASIILGVDINMEDNHKLYFESAKWIGTPYKEGGDSALGTDCSGLTFQIFQKVYNIQLPRNTEELKKKCHKISKNKLQEGDLVFFSSNRSKNMVAHVGIYLKKGQFIHASSSNGVIISHLNEKYYAKHWISGGRFNN